MASSADI